MVYRVVDIYEGYEILYKGTSVNAAKRARRQRVIDTDEECCVLIEERVLNEEGEYEWKVNNVIGGGNAMRDGIVICTEKDLAACRAYLAMAASGIRGFRARAACMAAARLDYWANVYRGLRWYPGGTIPFYADDFVPLVSTFRDLEQMILRRHVLIQYFENIGGHDEYVTAASGKVVYLSNTDLIMDDGPGAPIRLYPVCKLLAIILPDEE